MKYRDFMSLTDEEITQIVTDMFHPKAVLGIKRDALYCHFYVMMELDWDDDVVTYDEIDLTIPSIDNKGISADFSLNSEDFVKYNQFLLAKGCNIYLKDNPYLENEEKS